MPVDRIIKPFPDRSSEPGGAHTALLESELARRTEALIYRTGTNRLWAFPNSGKPQYGPIYAAYASVTALNTWTEFRHYEPYGGGGDYDTVTLPWHVSPGFDDVTLAVELVLEQAIKVMFRAQSITLVDAVATVAGDASLNVYAATRLDDQEWANYNLGRTSGLRSVWAHSRIHPTLPANRRVALYPQVQITDAVNVQIAAGGTIKVFLSSAMAWDTADEEAGI